MSERSERAFWKTIIRANTKLTFQTQFASHLLRSAQTIFGSESLLDAMGAGTNMLPIIGNIFSAVGNIIDIIDCKVERAKRASFEEDENTSQLQN